MTNPVYQHLGPFVNANSLDLNVARMEHLDGMRLPRQGVVYEPGCGVGLLTGYFEKYYEHVFSSDIQGRNVTANRYLHPWRGHTVLNVENAYRGGAFTEWEPFETVACYGLLYHVADPARLLRRLAYCCSRYLVLSTIVSTEDNGKVNEITEFAGPDQGTEGSGCSPARDWIMAELKKYFPYVYLSRKQPNHEDFPTEWPAKVPRYARAVFVASRRRADIPALSPRLLNRQARYEGAAK